MKNKHEGHYGGRYCYLKRRISRVCIIQIQPLPVCLLYLCLRFLERYFSFWSECIPAHVRHPWSASVISAISRSSPCQGHLARSSSWRLPVSRTRWSPLHTLRCCWLPLWRWDITSDAREPSAQAVSGRSGILKRAWHANEKKRCFPWLPENVQQCLIDSRWSERLDVFLELGALFVSGRSKSNFAFALCAARDLL